MTKGRAAVLALAVLALLLAVPSAGAKTKTLACGSNPALLLDKPGTYSITTAVNACNSPTLIQISSSDVTVDLGGRMLNGHSTTCLEGIHVDAGLKRVEIRNGAISLCNVGIRSAAHGPAVNKVVSFDNDLGMDVKVGSFRGNVVAHSAGTGMTDDSGGTFIGNTVVSSGSRGIDSNGTKLVRNNTFVDAGGYGVGGGSGGRIEGNRLLGNLGAGMFLEDGKIEDNTTIGNGGPGITTIGDPVVRGNRAIANAGDGVYTEGSSTKAEQNQTLANGGDGVRIGTGARAIDNRANGNLLRGVNAGDTTTIKSNRASGNVGLGIDAGATPTGLGTNKASRNNSLGAQCDPADLCVPDTSLDDEQTVFFLACPTTFPINAPGTYVLGASVSNCGGSTAIDIQSSDVTLDLGGHRIDGANQIAAGINVGNGLDNVIVRNGAISRYAFGLMAGDSDALVENIFAVENVLMGLAAGDGVRLERNTVVRTSHATSAGIVLKAGSKAIGNVVVANAYEGIRVEDGPVTIKGNEILGNGDAGIAAATANGNTISGNRLIGNGWVSIRVGNENTVSGNTIKGSNDYPIEAGANNTITRNKITGNNGGIDAETGNTVSENKVIANDGAGIRVEAGSLVARNKVIGNTGDGIVSPGAVTIKDNTTTGNGSNGIEAMAATGSGNVAKHNGAPDQCLPASLC